MLSLSALGVDSIATVDSNQYNGSAAYFDPNGASIKDLCTCGVNCIANREITASRCTCVCMVRVHTCTSALADAFVIARNCSHISEVCLEVSPSMLASGTPFSIETIVTLNPATKTGPAGAQTLLPVVLEFRVPPATDHH